VLKGGVGHLAQIIEPDLADRSTGLSKPQRRVGGYRLEHIGMPKRQHIRACSGIASARERE